MTLYILPSEMNSTEVLFEYADIYTLLLKLGHKVITANINAVKTRNASLKLNCDTDIIDAKTLKNAKNVYLICDTLTGEEYNEIYKIFKSAGLPLSVRPDDYEKTHYYSKDIYNIFEDVSPDVLITDINTEADCAILAEIPYRYVLKSRVGKIKGGKDMSYFDSTMARLEIFNQITKYREITEEINPMVRVERYLDLKKYDYNGKSITNEYRLWYLNQTLMGITSKAPRNAQGLATLSVNSLKKLPKIPSSVFYTVDIAEVNNNQQGLAHWAVLGIDNGTVSYFRAATFVLPNKPKEFVLDESEIVYDYIHNASLNSKKFTINPVLISKPLTEVEVPKKKANEQAKQSEKPKEENKSSTQKTKKKRKKH